MKKILVAVLVGICIVGVIAYTNGGPEKPESTIQIGEKKLSYQQKQRTNITQAMDVQNGNVSDVCYVYLDDEQNVYTIDGNRQLRSFIRSAPIPEEAAAAPGSDAVKVNAAITAAAALGVELEEGQLDSLNQAEYGYQLNFKKGKDPRIEDWVMITLDWNCSLSSLVVDNSGFESMDEVDAGYFDDAFAKYRKSLDPQPREVTVDYQRYGDAVLARYSLVFEDAPPPGHEDGARWVELVSFVDKRNH